MEQSGQIYSHECTSWMVFEDLTQNNTRLLHKNRDAAKRTIVPLVSSVSSPRKWIGLGNLVPGGTRLINLCSGVNASGLAVIVNSGEKSIEVSYPEADMSTPVILEGCLAHCDTAEQAVEYLKGAVEAHRYSHGRKGSIFMFMDRKEAMIVEVTSQRLSVQKYNGKYAVRANVWHNPDMAAVARNDIDAWLNSANREYMLMRDFNRAIDTNKKITVQDCVYAARDKDTPVKSPIQRTLCSKSTNSASTFEIDLQYPEVLTTGYFLIGPPRHTICVPVPICVQKLHPTMTTDLCWSKAAWDSFDQFGYDKEIPEAWTEFEKISFQRFEKAKQEARKLLEQNNRKAAQTLLNETAFAIWDEAANLMNLSLTPAPAPAPAPAPQK